MSPGVREVHPRGSDNAHSHWLRSRPKPVPKRQGLVSIEERLESKEVSLTSDVGEEHLPRPKTPAALRAGITRHDPEQVDLAQVAEA